MMNRLFATTAVGSVAWSCAGVSGGRCDEAPDRGRRIARGVRRKPLSPTPDRPIPLGGAAEQSSAPPSSGAASAQKSAEGQSFRQFRRRQGAKLGA